MVVVYRARDAYWYLMAQKTYPLHVVERGHGPPVILLHGNLSTHRYWLNVAELLESKCRLLMPDLLGFGKSPKPRNASYDLAQYVACLEQTFRNYRFSEPPVLVGHSMGALIALHWAVKRPEMFSKLILCSPIFIEESLLYQQMASIPLQGRMLVSRAAARGITTAMGLSSFVPSGLAVRLLKSWPKHIIEDATRHHYYVYRKLLKNRHFKAAVLAEIKQLQIPTVLLIGQRDMLVHPALTDIQKFCTEQKGCHVDVLASGHQLPLEYPEAVADAILTYNA